jgi:hypothetical protein
LFVVLSLFVVVIKQKSIRVKMITLILILFLILFLILARVTPRVRIANPMVMDSYCRGGIVNIPGGCSRALLERPNSSKALWRFRASTSNSLSGRAWPPTYTPMRHIYQTYAQQDIRVYEDDHFEPPMRQLANPKSLWLLRVSI